MRCAVDAHAIGRHLTGNEVYIRNLLNAFAEEGPDCEWVAYVAADEARESLSPRIRTRRVASNPFVRLGAHLTSAVWRDQADLLHVQYTAPLACPAPVVVSVHDVSFIEHPEYFTRERAFQLQWTVGRTVRMAARVLTGSEFFKTAILKVYGDLDESKVTVVPNAASAEFRCISHDAARRRVLERFGLAEPFLLSVGDLQPRKNQVGLIQSFARMVRAFPQFSQHLVLVGKESWFAGRVRQAAVDSGVADRIHFLGFVSDAELLHLYNACDIFVFPSYYEGFGLPPLEAMACGRAVVCSSASALPEVVDGAALLFDPYSIDEMVRAMSDLLLDAELKARMERLGVQRAAQFSWQRTAQKTLDVFQAVAERSRSLPRPARTATLAQQ